MGHGRPITTPFVLRDYALLADGERAALVGPDGGIAWMCFPGFGDDAVFAGLLGSGGGYRLTPAGRYVWGGRYEEGLVWRDRWIVGQDIVECREALAVPATPTRAVLLRRVLMRHGRGRVRVALDLRSRYGTAPATDVRRDEHGVWRALIDTAHVAWAGAGDATPDDDGDDGTTLAFDLDLEPGDEHDLVLVLDAEGPPDVPGAHQAWSGTERVWRERLPDLPAAAGRRDARFACAVLSGLTASTGGTVAAATTAMPERAREGRNYDYRYVWIRDACYVGQAAARAGATHLLDASSAFVTARILEHGPDLAPAYTTRGERVPEERELEVPGYPGALAVVGNRVRDQFQLDAFGEALLLYAAAADAGRVDADRWRAADAAAEAIAARWTEPDAGIWELEPRWWAHSRLVCVAGLHAAARHQPARGPAGRWLVLADAILAETAARCLHSSGRWQRAPDDPRPDAALLLAGLRGAVPAEDPRTVATLHAVTEHLTQDGYCYRFRPDARPLDEAEGAFLLCGFWLAMAWRQQGDDVAAARWFERNRAACGSPGLFTEEFDVGQRQLRGNLPQAFVHALLLESATS